MPKMIGLINDDKSIINKKFLESELNNKVPITRKVNGQSLDKDIEIVGARGTGILKVTTAPASYTTAIGEYTPKYRIALSTVTSQSGVSEVLLGDVIQYSYYQYLVSYLDSTYAYISATRTSLRGADGSNGTSVTITSVSESAADSGSNMVTFSDGNTLTVKNGGKGSPGLVWRGTWDENGFYSSNDAVHHNGNAYICIGGENIPSGIEPGTNDSFWSILTARGSDGDTGLVWCGEWNDNDEYQNNEVVYHNGSSFIAVIDEGEIPSGIEPGTDDATWQMLASKGLDGTSVTVKSVSESGADGGNNVVTFSDGKTVTIKNGGKGSTGATGATGATGPAGYTPVKGIDYFTEADQEAIVQQVISALGTPVFGTVDLNKVITLNTDRLVDGTYTLGYEGENGEFVELCTLKKGGPSYTNQLPISTDASGAVYNGTGYKVGYRFRSSSEESALSVANATNPAFITGFIPVSKGQTVYLENCYFDTNGINGSPSSTETKNYYGEACSSMNILLCAANKATLNAVSWVNAASSEYFTMTPDANGIVTEFIVNRDAIAYIRLGLAGDASNAIITVDQPITD